MKLKRVGASVALAVLFTANLLAPAIARAQEEGGEQRNTAMHMGLGIGSALLTMVYGPVKILYSLTGTLIGGLAFTFTGGRNDVARAIIQPSVRGDYVITPEHLTFERPWVFSGRDPELEQKSEN